MKCPRGLENCEGCGFPKDDGTGKSLCDWPYHRDMTPREIKEVTEKGIDN